VHVEHIARQSARCGIIFMLLNSFGRTKLYAVPKARDKNNYFVDCHRPGDVSANAQDVSLFSPWFDSLMKKAVNCRVKKAKCVAGKQSQGCFKFFK
jgi:hypothetical protein